MRDNPLQTNLLVPTHPECFFILLFISQTTTVVDYSVLNPRALCFLLLLETYFNSFRFFINIFKTSIFSSTLPFNSWWCWCSQFDLFNKGQVKICSFVNISWHPSLQNSFWPKLYGRGQSCRDEGLSWSLEFQMSPYVSTRCNILHCSTVQSGVVYFFL